MSKILEYRKKHKKCKYCKHLKVDGSEFSWCSAKKKLIPRIFPFFDMEEVPRNFCQCYEVRE